MDLTLNLILAKVDIFLDIRNVKVITPPFTRYFKPEGTSFRENYIHISDFPNRLLKINDNLQIRSQIASKMTFTMLSHS